MNTLRMFVFVHGVLFSVYVISYECEGKIIPPPDGKVLIFLPGSSRNITWDIDDEISTVASRTWSFTSSDGLRSGTLGVIPLDLQPQTQNNVLPRFEIIKPATLELNNVDHRYDGTYKFTLAATESHISNVMVFIAKKPNVIFTCSSPITVTEGDDVTCVCQGEGGRPPVNVTWYKDGVQIGETKKENNTLTLNNVNGTDNGTYKCEARSYVGDEYVDAKYIEAVVKTNSKPSNTTITIKPSQTTVGETVVITCYSEGVPDPHFTIMHNGQNITTKNPYTIDSVQDRYEGTYTCIAINDLGYDTFTGHLNVTESATLQPTTLITTTMKGNQTATEAESTTLQLTTLITTIMKSNQTGKNSPSSDECSGTKWYIVVVSLVSGIIIGILLSFIVWCSHRRWFKNKIPERNTEPQTTEVDTTYQELDLTQMNNEDNYQSLRMNAESSDAANQDESTYSQLTKARDVESKYQSLA